LIDFVEVLRQIEVVAKNRKPAYHLSNASFIGIKFSIAVVITCACAYCFYHAKISAGTKNQVMVLYR